jgi:general secretion pathway protein A
MYKEFYGLKEDPFSISPDPDFIYWSQKHLAAFRHLMYSIHRKKGLILLTGEIGAGKTTLINALIKEISEKTQIASVSNSEIDVPGLFEFIFHSFGLQSENNKVKNLIKLNEFLIKSRNEDKDIIVILDEAHNFSNDVLEEIRLLSNIETPKEKLLQIVMVGQPGLLDKINGIGFEQVRQRVGMSYYLRPLSKAETSLYIKKRLEISGTPNSALFRDDAIDEVFTYSKGIPRVINTICDNALLFGAAERSPQINASIIKRVVESLYLNKPPEQYKTPSMPYEEGIEEGMENTMEATRIQEAEVSPYVRISHLQAAQHADGSPLIALQERSTRRRLTLLLTAAGLAVAVLSGLLLAKVDIVQQALATLTSTFTNTTQDKVPPGRPTEQSPNKGSELKPEPQPRLPSQQEATTGLLTTTLSDPATLKPAVNPVRPTGQSAATQELPVRLLSKSEPEYPAVARRLGWEGTVTLLMELLADGTVGEVSVIASSNYPLLDETAKQAVKKWTHIPARRDGVPIVQWTTQNVPFKLGDTITGQGEPIRQAQGRLKTVGFYPGPIDGFLGPRTREALRKYQESKGLQVTGELDRATRVALQME